MYIVSICISRVEQMPHGNKNTKMEILVWYGIKLTFYSLKPAGCLIDSIIGKKSLVSLVWAAFKILRSVFKITGKTCVTRKPWFKILQKQEGQVVYGTAVSQADMPFKTISWNHIPRHVKNFMRFCCSLPVVSKHEILIMFS